MCQTRIYIFSHEPQLTEVVTIVGSRMLLRIGVLVQVVSIAWDPFAQQLVQYSQGNVYSFDQTATVPRCQRFSKGNKYFVGNAEVGPDTPST